MVRDRFLAARASPMNMDNHRVPAAMIGSKDLNVADLKGRYFIIKTTSVVLRATPG
jgi:hypothetical protein